MSSLSHRTAVKVIFTRSDGTTVIEKWSKGEKTEVNTGDKDTLIR